MEMDKTWPDGRARKTLASPANESFASFGDAVLQDLQNRPKVRTVRRLGIYGDIPSGTAKRQADVTDMIGTTLALLRPPQ